MLYRPRCHNRQELNLRWHVNLQNGYLWINDHRRIVNAFEILDLDYCNSILYGFKKQS